jgi:hypothetical protein
MKGIGGLAILALGISLSAAVPSSAQPLEVEPGLIEGVRDGAVAVYKSIPYAARPSTACVGRLLNTRCDGPGTLTACRLPTWPRFTTKNERVIRLGDTIAAGDVPNLEGLRRLDDFYAGFRARR